MDFRQFDCLVGNRRISYTHLLASHVCAACGSHLTTRWNCTGWQAGCIKCHGQDFITKAQYEKQVSEASEVLAGLPADLANILKGA